MTIFQAVELNKRNKFPNKESTIKRDVKIIIGSATIYVPFDATKSLQAIIRELSNTELRINR
ncbi:hypothetical protein CHL78_010020 [Romboutsia weinsteinii]|uniref:Uncharacterized protein n=1 Tax=Romboutsia weinsteinii TaxID=2020949 RepID=A0A371J3M2_9FIRM|nr:hypothetical protein [Romboutsia weinsteinii]RDY27313.1 hypothetical protein CHL78_010020 [Romboutsia weinsteinii]